MDKELIASFLEGSETAFRQIMRLYQERLFAVILSMTHHREDALDILQDTWIKAYRALPQFRFQSSLYTWLCRIAMNTAVSALRKPNRSAELPDYILDTRPNPLQMTMRRESHEYIHWAISELPEKQKMVFILKYLDENTYAEIADIMGISVGAVKAQCFHAFSKVQKFMLENYPVKESIL